MTEAEILKSLRKDVFLTACAGGGGHLASSFSSMEILYVLYGRGVLRVRPQEPDWAERDVLILSKGHAALALYANLVRAGFFTQAEMAGYCKPGSVLGGEPSGPEIPGVETPTGSLGHGLSFGVGAALGAKLNGSGSRTFVLLGDGECQEGSVWEAATAASALGLEHLTAILDANQLQKMGAVEAVTGAISWPDRWSAFGWETLEVDGHDVDALTTALRGPSSGRPRVVIAHTVKGKGVSIMENVAKWHYRMPGKKETRAFMEELEISEEELADAKSLYQCAL